MSRTVTASEANQGFSRLLREASEGATITITQRGRPVATLAPVADEMEAKRAAARERLHARWANVEHRVVGPWTRDELYDRDVE